MQERNKIRSNGKQFIYATFFSIIAVALNYLISLFMTSYVTETLGAVSYGYISLAKNIASYASIVSIAFNSFAARYISISYHEGNFRKANAYFNSVFYADCIITIVVITVSIPILINLEKLIVIPDELVADVKLLFSFNIINTLIISMTTVFLTASVIRNRLELSNIAKCLAYILEGGFLIIVFSLMRPHNYYVGAGLIVSSITILLINAGITRRQTPELKIRRNYVSGEALREVLGAGIWNAINNLGNTLNTGLDLLITNLLLNPLQVGQLGIVKTISIIFSSLFQLLAQPFQPIQLRYYASGQRNKLVDSFKLGIKINGLLSNIAFGGFAVFGTAYLKLWVPKQDITLIQSILLVTIIGSIIEGAIYPLYYVYTLTVKNKIPCLVTILSGFFNVFGMIVLLKYTNIGLYGVTGTTTVLTWVVNFVFNPIYSAYCLGERKNVFYPTIIRHILSCVAITVLFVLFSKLFFPSTWAELILCALLCAVAGAIVHTMIVFDKNEKKQLLYKFKSIMAKMER